MEDKDKLIEYIQKAHPEIQRVWVILLTPKKEVKDGVLPDERQ